MRQVCLTPPPRLKLAAFTLVKQLAYFV
ncbi:hypothetical protein AVEN_263486-1, partial [Araneus ventricosus]